MMRVKTYEEMSALAAGMIGAQVILKPDCVLGLATGSSPIGTYKKLVESCEKGLLDFSGVRTVNLDEYCGLSGDNPNSYRYFMNDNLFDHVNIDKANTHVPNGFAEDLEAEAARYESFIESLGGVDLQLLGIGHNGHIGFNEPGEAFVRETHVVDLTERTIEANARFFAHRDEVPRQALTVTIPWLTASSHLFCIVPSAAKRAAVEAALTGPVTTACPASILQQRPGTRMYIDADCAGALMGEERP